MNTDLIHSDYVPHFDAKSTEIILKREFGKLKHYLCTKWAAIHENCWNCAGNCNSISHYLLRK